MLTNVTQGAHRGEVRRYAPRVAYVNEILVQSRCRSDDLRHRRHDLVEVARINLVLSAGTKVRLVVGLVLKVVTDPVLALVLRRVERDDAVGKGEVIPFGAVGDGPDLRLEELKATQ